MGSNCPRVVRDPSVTVLDFGRVESQFIRTDHPFATDMQGNAYLARTLNSTEPVQDPEDVEEDLDDLEVFEED